MQIGVRGLRVAAARCDHGFMIGVALEIGSYRNARSLPRWFNELANKIWPVDRKAR